ncbi:conserved Plasmodium protein, unknown function [Plasmodium relictum]|uniref:Liver specific protein 1 n=1 Tax=Plasmodium relictum TaxID=85471 RepID=A0A1J1HD56_PLARL|nr:conserved Plasmodium protein, unknown function [Plasmodium relictum]CRH03014.1 conserved Plasmodium protein, unknown function [Plasmodium relictum]
MLFFKFILVSLFICVHPKALCNLIIHPSLADFFVENFRDNVYISSNNVINKKLSSPYCSSCDDLDCHNINKDNTENEKKVTKKKERCDEEEQVKYIYLHTNPFFTTIKEETMNKVKKEKENNEKHNIFYKFFHFLLDTFSFFTKTDNQIKNSKKLYSYFIDKNKTNILNNSTDLTNSNNKYKIKGLYMGENLGDMRSLSFLSPLSLAIDEINFNQIFKHAWDNSYSNYIYLKNSNSYTDKRNNNIEKRNLIKEKNSIYKENSENINKKNIQEDEYNYDEDEDENNNDNSDSIHLKKSFNLINNNNLLLRYIMRYNEDLEYFKIFKKIENEISLNTASSILKKLNIEIKNNFDEVFKNNKNLNIGICTRDKEKNSSLSIKRINLKLRTLDSLLWKKKKNNSNYIFGCVFFHSIENSELIFNLKKRINPNDNHTQYNNYSYVNYNGEFSKNYKKDKLLFINKKNNESMKVSGNVIYEEWKKFNSNKSKLMMLSTNILSNLKKYKDYNYSKNIYKLQIDYNGVCKNVVFIYKYHKKMFLDFLFQMDVCYNNNYINKNIHFNYINTSIRANFILKGMWNYGILKNIINIEIYNNSLKKKNNNNNSSSSCRSNNNNNNNNNDINNDNNNNNDINNENGDNKYNFDHSKQSHFHENFYIYNDLYDLKSVDYQKEKIIDDNLRFNEKGKIYMYEKVLNSKIQSSERFKRMKLLNIQNNTLEEKKEHTFLINKSIKESNDILLLSKKGYIEFETPVVLTELFIGFHYNPLYEFLCKKNKSKLSSSVNLSYYENEKSEYLNEYVNKIYCSYKRPYHIYIFFNFFLNNNKKYNIKLEMHIDYLKNFRSSEDVPFQHLNVLNYLKSNINYYRINKIEIEYSFFPFSQGNEFFDHSTLPFYISINNLIINQSKKVYNYVPIFYTNKINFLQVISRNAKNKRKKKSDKIKDTENIKKENNSYISEEKIKKENNENEGKYKIKDELYSTNFPKLFQNEHFREKKYCYSIGNSKNKYKSNYINFNSFSIFTSINEKIFLKHLMQYSCTNSNCTYEENTMDFLLNNLKKKHKKKKKNLNNKREENFYMHNHLSFEFEPILINPFFETKKNTKEEKLSEIQNEYFNFLKTDLSKYLKEDTKNIVAYNMKKLYTFEFINENYVIPPYNKGIFINFEIKNEKIFLDPYNKFSYIKQELKENFYNDTRKVFDIIYIYSALLPAESDLFDFNYLTKNKLTLKRIQSENAKTMFKNIIPFTRYEDFYDFNQEYSQKIFNFNTLDFKNNSLNNELIDLTIDNTLNKTKIIEFIQSKLQNALQLNSEEKKT